MVHSDNWHYVIVQNYHMFSFNEHWLHLEMQKELGTQGSAVVEDLPSDRMVVSTIPGHCGISWGELALSCNLSWGYMSFVA